MVLDNDVMEKLIDMGGFFTGTYLFTPDKFNDVDIVMTGAGQKHVTEIMNDRGYYIDDNNTTTGSLGSVKYSYPQQDFFPINIINVDYEDYVVWKIATELMFTLSNIETIDLNPEVVGPGTVRVSLKKLHSWIETRARRHGTFEQFRGMIKTITGKY